MHNSRSFPLFNVFFTSIFCLCQAFVCIALVSSEFRLWKSKNYMAIMRTVFQDEAAQLISSDLSEMGAAANKLAQHVINLGISGFGVSILELIASIAAIYLLILDRTNWKTNILTSLLIPYIFFSLPSWIFNVFRGEVGKWIALIAVVLRLFLPRHFPDWLELPAALILLIVVAPGLFANTCRSNAVGVAICLVIACYLLQEHIRASGGFRNSFTKAHGISNTVGIILLLVFPIWTLVLYIV
ncbi:cold-regulated 413 plasma membrane protein 1-like [Gastrolobium bilobum]|uniref:cold-regulated 413 plasma membrane protein 1-like n=1 Tax=Gastrolobium bilobum TaxID=150636 RepID=UPI002AB252D1|nr:cold-regulated 413 plasma membrane protein 1-like [Gastrolobium bilobum]